MSAARADAAGRARSLRWPNRRQPLEKWRVHLLSPLPHCASHLTFANRSRPVPTTPGTDPYERHRPSPQRIYLPPACVMTRGPSLVLDACTPSAGSRLEPSTSIEPRGCVPEPSIEHLCWLSRGRQIDHYDWLE